MPEIFLSYARDDQEVAMGSWDDRGHIVLGLQSFGALLRVPAVGGVPEEAVSLREETGVAWMDVLPGGEWVLFTSTPRNQVNWSDANIVAQNLSTGERRLIVKGGHYPRYLPTGHLLFARGGSLHAVAFDARRVATRGREVPVVQGVATNEANGYAPYAVSPSDGTLIYLAGQSVGLIANLRSVVRVDRDGNARPISAEPRVYGGARASPDGTSLAVEVTDADKRVHIWVMDVESGTAAQLTFDGDENRFPVWTADGREVIYVSQRGQEYGLWRMSADGTGQPRRILTGSDALVPTDVYGSTLIYQDRGAGEERDLFALDLDGDGKPRVLLSTPDDEAGARVSPDGAWLAYTSTPGGGSTTQRRVMVRPWPDPAAGGQRAISEGLGSGSVWSPAGDEIYYMVATSPIPLISTRLSRTGTTLMPGARRKLFDILGSFEFTRTGRALGYGWAFDVMPDTGEIIAVVSGTLQSSAAGGPGAPDRKLHVVLNWTEELKRLVPTD